MKKLYILAFLLFPLSHLHSQTANISLLENDYNHLLVDVVTPDFTVSEVFCQDTKYALLDMPGYLLATQVGAPSIPVGGTMIEIPVCSQVKVNVLQVEYDTMSLGSDIPLYPAQPSRSKSDTAFHPLVVNEDIYGQDEYFGFDLARFEYYGIARDVILGRLVVSPVRYNPQTSTIIVCRKAVVEVLFEDSDVSATERMKQLHHSDAFKPCANTLNHFSCKSVSNSAPVRMLIVSDSTFRNNISEYVAWKRRKGFRVDVVLNNNPEMGRTKQSIAAYLKRQYTEATIENPAPTFVLIVGDVKQIPACDDQHPADAYWYEEHHPTDLYYATWSDGDNLPDCYYGRFSAENTAQLMPQIEKTLMYEQYTFPDPSFLDNAVLVAGRDGGRTGDFGYEYADPTMDYIARNYVNSNNGYASIVYFKNNPSNTNTPSMENLTVYRNNSRSQVAEQYSVGAGLINYSAHGDINKWTDPEFTTSNVASMTNTKKFGLMIGNCCLSNKFDEHSVCFGESLLRKDGYCGAVNYIGGSNYTYWNEDVYWSAGYRSSINSTTQFQYNSNRLGMYDQLFHVHNENQSDWATSVGAIMMAGNMAVQGSNSDLKEYYWEIYHIMGDPSVQPYLTQPQDMYVTINRAGLTVENPSFTVQTIPYGYVALTKDGLVQTAAFADFTGFAQLEIPNPESGNYELAVSSMGYKTAFLTLDLHSVGIQDVAVEKLSVTPNPARDYVEIRIPELVRVMLYNASGILVESIMVQDDFCRISLSNLAKGIYYMKAITRNDTFDRVIVKE